MGSLTCSAPVLASLVLLRGLGCWLPVQCSPSVRRSNDIYSALYDEGIGFDDEEFYNESYAVYYEEEAPEAVLTCRCGDRCVFKLPEKPRKPNYAALSNFLGEKALQSTQERLSQAVLAGEIRNKEKSHDTIKFGFLVEMMSPSSLGAVSLAVDSVNADEELLPNVKLEFSFERIHKKTLGVEFDAIAKMTEMRDQGVLAFVGSGFSCKSEALVAAAWNLPMIAFQCSDKELSDKSVYPTFVRTQPPSEMIAKSVLAVLQHFHWMRVVVVTTTSGLYLPINDAFQSLATSEGISINRTMYISLNYLSKRDRPEMKGIIESTKDITRIYVFIGDRGALMDFALLLNSGGMLSNGEYAVVAADMEVNLGEDGNCQKYLVPAWNSAKDVREVHEAFRSVLLVLPAHKDARMDSTYKNMINEIYNRSTMEPFCEPYHDLMKKAKIPIQASFMYDAVKIYAKAADRILRRGGDLRDGAAVVATIIEEGVFHSDLQGIDVHIDNKGDSEGKYVLLAMVHGEEESLCNESGSSYIAVGNFEAQKGSVQVRQPDVFSPNGRAEKILWPGGSPPAGQPLCGFSNELCRISFNRGVVLALVVVVAVVIVATGFARRKYLYEQRLARLLWKVDYKDIKDVSPLLPMGRQVRQEKDYFGGEDNTSFSTRYSSPCGEEVPFYGLSTADLEGSAAAATTRSSRLAVNSLGDDDDCSLTRWAFHASSSTHALKTAPFYRGLYRGNQVVLKRILKKNVDLKRADLKELNSMRELRHDNLVPFLGACLEHDGIVILMPFCSRGGLDDVLRNEDYSLDNMFVASLVQDLIKGMIYLHESEIGFHGNLRSSNCLVDTRWVLQVADFGFRRLRSGSDLEECESFHAKQRLLWQSPEVLRQHLRARRRRLRAAAAAAAGATIASEATPTTAVDWRHHQSLGSQKADVYAFGIILYEVVGLSGPWGIKDMNGWDVQDIVERVVSSDGEEPHRPPLEAVSCEDYIKQCLRDCWREEPNERPDFRSVRQRLNRMQSGLKPNIFDNMLAIMEKYASNLESQVAERTHLLMEEKKKTDALLYSMLPRTVADSLKQGLPAQAESFDCVTIYFSDVVGFTEISAASTPMEVVMLLNDLYTCFDSTIENYDVYKIETIGDAYMVASGLPVPNGNNHAAEIAAFALHLVKDIKSFKIRHMPGKTLLLRIGVHSGPCVAGVVGHKRPRYCLFGDTVNTASRMESMGEPLMIHVSNNTYDILLKVGNYQFEKRAKLWIKGKGEMQTYFLLSGGPFEDQTHEVSTQTATAPDFGTRRSSSRRAGRYGRHRRTEKDIFDLIQDIP